MKRILLCSILVFCISLTSCSSSSKSESQNGVQRDATSEEIAVLARTLYKNHEQKGARYELKSGNIPNGFVADATVSWEDNAVLLNVSLLDENVVDIAALTTVEGVYETLLTVDSNTGFGKDVTVLRKFDPTMYGVDALSQFLIKLATESPENPVLLRQQGVTRLGEDTIDGEKVEQFKISDSVTYFINDKGELKMVQAHIKGFANPVTITLKELEEQSDLGKNTMVPSFSFENIPSGYWNIRPGF